MGSSGLAAEDFKITRQSQDTACNSANKNRGAKWCLGWRQESVKSRPMMKDRHSGRQGAQWECDITCCPWNTQENPLELSLVQSTHIWGVISANYNTHTKKHVKKPQKFLEKKGM